MAIDPHTLDLTKIVDSTAEKMWNARLMMDDRPAWEEVPLMAQNSFKESILPVIFQSIPSIEEAIREHDRSAESKLAGDFEEYLRNASEETKN